jgi:murein DD-endopeptidase MepM/ murein hydrolase activator NlpD
VTEESRDPEATDTGGRPEHAGAASNDEVYDPPEHAAASGPRPSLPESIDTVPGRDRGRTVALATLGALVALGGVLIARGPRHLPDAPAPPSAAVLSSASLPPPAAPPSPSASAAPPQADPRPRPAPAWRVAALEHDPAHEIVRGTLGKLKLAAALAQSGISKTEIRRITHSVDGIRRIERGVAKDAFVIARDRAKGTVDAFEYIASPTEVWQAKNDDGLVAKKLELFVEKKRAAVALVVTADLVKAIATAGLRQEALEEIEDALEGYGETAIIKPGVRLRVVAHEEWVDGTFARFDVDAVEYVPRTGSPLRVYFYERDASVEASRRSTPHRGFYDAKGQQPFRGMFRSPVPLARMTSRFNPKRMHPVLHVVMPHNGVDFGASTGTPVFASGPGTVQSAGDGGPCGNMVQIIHSNGLTTAYCHLSRFASGLRSGQHVEARQLVGYVGQTGRATGPHLHFAVKRGGSFLDPMVLKMDGVRTLPPADRDALARRRADLDVALEAIALPSVEGVAVDEKDEIKDEPAGEE